MSTFPCPGQANPHLDSTRSGPPDNVQLGVALGDEQLQIDDPGGLGINPDTPHYRMRRKPGIPSRKHPTIAVTPSLPGALCSRRADNLEYIKYFSRPVIARRFLEKFCSPDKRIVS